MPDDYTNEKEVRDWSQSICPITLMSESARLCFGAQCPMFNAKYNSCAVVTTVRAVGYNLNQIGRAAYAYNRSLFRPKS